MLNSKIIECRISEVKASGSVVNKSFKNEDYLVQYIRVESYRIRYSLKSIQKAVVEAVYCILLSG